MNETKHLFDAYAILRQRRDAIALGPEWPWRFLNRAMSRIDTEIDVICHYKFRTEAL